MSLLTAVHGYGTLAARPAAGNAGRIYYATDTEELYRDNGASWDTLTITGAALTTQSAQLSSPLTMVNASTWYDVCTLTLAAGTWEVTGQAVIINPAGTLVPEVRLYDGSSQLQFCRTYQDTANTPRCLGLVPVVVTPGTSTTYHFQAQGPGWANCLVEASAESYMTAIRLG